MQPPVSALARAQQIHSAAQQQMSQQQRLAQSQAQMAMIQRQRMSSIMGQNQLPPGVREQLLGVGQNTNPAYNAVAAMNNPNPIPQPWTLPGRAPVLAHPMPMQHVPNPLV